ncbi:uncharacterized protein LOC110755029 [Prunus avium]|uniref:Uncharacterized protein LOC110755029 n=1 Tax=Prunus avium TaxID=42229 RepID=A0A6P5S7X1_PRUAV|nr:uncharacterized protein LOC110755029 [Prunus avium]
MKLCMKRLVFSGISWILAFLLCVSPSAVKTQIPGCSMVGLDLEHCLKPSSGFISMDDTCCTALNQLVQAGYGCLCSLIATSPSLPLLGTPLSLPLSNCYISAPPLTQCQVVAPKAEGVPPNGPHEEIAQPSGPTDHRVAPVAPVEVLQAPLNLTSNGNATVLEAKQPPVTKSTDDISNSEEKTKLHPLPMLLLSLALQACKALY